MKFLFLKNRQFRLFILLGVLGSIVLLASCKDDELPPTETDFHYTEQMLDEINANAKSLKLIVNALKQGICVKSYTALTDGTGYGLEFADGSTTNIRTTLTALNTESDEIGYIPQIGTDEYGGIYYWTLDGKWLSVGATDKKIPVIDGVGRTPVVGITEDGYWKITSGGLTRILPEKVQVSKGESNFKRVDVSDPKYIVFIFADGTPEITLPVNADGGDGPSPVTGSIRRVISPEQPAWLIHIDTWLTPDPQKIIDMVPKDILPYVIFNISLSVSRDGQGVWNQVQYGYETAKSWLRTCAENRVWAMVQPASGAYCHLPDLSDDSEIENSPYNEFFRDYPNFLGFNYCEQFWGFGGAATVSYPQRLVHWTHLMKLCRKYGGYLMVSFCNAYWGAALNPIAMMKRDANFANACGQYPENFILCEKYTSKNGFFDTESACLGAYLSGFSGQYGIRFDQCGWKEGLNGDLNFPVPAGAIPIVEHVMLTGQTVIDGPELITKQCYREVSATKADDGYTTRRWEFFSQFDNISVHIFRKILDGTIRIMSRKEVIDRSKVIIIHDVNSGNDIDKYCTPETLYEGLYRMDDDGNIRYNENFFKKTGRYPTIPVAYQLNDAEANSFVYKVNKSEYTGRWSNTQAKIREFNSWFPQEYTGELYAGRSENGWVTYNPGQRSEASIPFKYNTCERMELSYSKYSLGVIREYADRLTFYLTNYDNVDTSLKKDVVKIYGSSSKPGYSYTDRAKHTASKVTEDWSNGVFTLTVTHNGPLDITINCSGNATGRETVYRAATVTVPESPQIYEGELQYEAEHFDYKNIAGIHKNAVTASINNYTALGYLEFGTNSSAAVRDRVRVLSGGMYSLRIKYRSPVATVNSIDLYVNGSKVGTPEFVQTENSDGAWRTITQSVNLHAGDNSIELRANAGTPGDFYLDHIIIKKM